MDLALSFTVTATLDAGFKREEKNLSGTTAVTV